MTRANHEAFYILVLLSPSQPKYLPHTLFSKPLNPCFPLTGKAKIHTDTKQEAKL
jgi:hypothetical protein